eukprot:4125427-Alexandrium_andersonii.AAC.1
MYASYWCYQREYQYGDPDDDTTVEHVCPRCIAIEYDLLGDNGEPDVWQGIGQIKKREGAADSSM